MQQGVLVVVYALVDVGFTEEADLFAGDVSKGVVKFSYAAESQPLQTAQAQLQQCKTYRELNCVILVG